MVLNALQLETSSGENESKALAQSYVKSIREKLNSIDLDNSFRDLKPVKV